jgi:hypothetical protein
MKRDVSRVLPVVGGKFVRLKDSYTVAKVLHLNEWAYEEAFEYEFCEFCHGDSDNHYYSIMNNNFVAICMDPHAWKDDCPLGSDCYYREENLV